MRYLMGILFYLKNIVLWLDQGLNVLLMGDPDETLSRRAGRARAKGRAWGCYLCKVLDWIDPRHCTKSINGDDEYEGKNSVPQMVSRWSKGLPATWTPEFVYNLSGNQTIHLGDLEPGQFIDIELGEAYSPEDINKLERKK